MRALLLAEMDGKLVNELEKLIEVETGGWYTSNKLLEENELIDRLQGKEVLITSYDNVTEDVLEACPNLKLIACTRSNPVNIDSKAATARGIPIIYTPGRNANSAAEYTIGLMLDIVRNISHSYARLLRGDYIREGSVNSNTVAKKDVTWALGEGSPYLECKGFELRGKTLGIIGFGQIGRKVADLAKAFGMSITVYDPNIVNVDDDVHYVNLDELLLNSDIVTLHAAVVPETIGLIDKRALSLMKESAFLINTSRGAIVNENDLIEALRMQSIAGAALDVFSSEPLQSDHPFLNDLQNVVVTPHIAGATHDAITIHTKMIISDIKRYLNGYPLEFQYKKGGAAIVN